MKKETSLKSLFGTGSGRGRRRWGSQASLMAPTLSMNVSAPLSTTCTSPSFTKPILLQLIKVLLISFSLSVQRPPTAGFGSHFGADRLPWASLPAGDLA